MSTNCIRCIKAKRTGADLLCDQCRRPHQEAGAAFAAAGMKAAKEYADARLRDCIVLTAEKMRTWFAAEIYSTFFEGMRCDARLRSSPLIAAAPELLAACEAAVSVLPVTLANGWHSGIDPVRDQLRAAIAKAGGAA